MTWHRVHYRACGHVLAEKQDDAPDVIVTAWREEDGRCPPCERGLASPRANYPAPRRRRARTTT